MAEKKAATKSTTKKSASSSAPSKGLSAFERAAMKERLAELKAEEAKADGEAAVQAKIAEMPKSDRDMAERIHAIVSANAPHLAPRTWYGMPAYTKDGKVVCFFKGAHKYGSRYATFGFEDAAHLDDGAMWPTSYALTKLSAKDEAKLAALVKKAAS